MALVSEASEEADGKPRKRGRAVSRDDLNNKLFFRLFQASNIYETQARWAFSISAVQGATLGALSRSPDGMPLAELCAYLSVSRQNAHVVFGRLERAGLIERQEDASDRRKRTVRLTQAGRVAWADLRQRNVDFFRRGTKGLTSEEVEICADMLARIRRALIGMRDD